MDGPTDDEQRRRREINMFAAFALGGEKPIDGFLDNDVAFHVPSDESNNLDRNEFLIREEGGDGDVKKKSPDFEISSSSSPPPPILSSSPSSNSSTLFHSSASIPTSIDSNTDPLSKDLNGSLSRRRLRDKNPKPWNSSVWHSRISESEDDGLVLTSTHIPSSWTRQTAVQSSVTSLTSLSLLSPQQGDRAVDSELHSTLESWKDPIMKSENNHTFSDSFRTFDPAGVVEGACAATEDGSGTFLKSPSLPLEEPNTGTFTFSNNSAHSNKPNAAEQANLDAAVAALSKLSEKNHNATSKRTSRIMLPTPLLAQQRQYHNSTTEIGLFAEQVVMPRPLFFGPMLPPRVLLEAHQLVRNSLEYFEKQSSSSTLSPTKSTRPVPRRLNEFPADVRNVVGVLRTFGYGLFDDMVKELQNTTSIRYTNTSWFEPQSGDNNNRTLHFCGNQHVSTFQPIWGNDVRVERVKNYRKQQKKEKNLRRPKQLSRNDRSSTAPARLPIAIPSDDDDDETDYFDESENDVSLVDFFPDDEQSFSPLQRLQNIYTDMETDNPAIGAISENQRLKAPGVQHPTQKRPSTGLSPNELFSLWLRNDEESYPGKSTNEGLLKHRPNDSIAPISSPHPIAGKTITVDASGLKERILTNPLDLKKIEAYQKDTTNSGLTVKTPLSEQEIFSLWAQGNPSSTSNTATGSQLGTSAFCKSNENTTFKDSPFQSLDTGCNFSDTFNPTDTFQKMRPLIRSDRGSDDGSVIDDEQKKQVGVNDHLSKAIALLSEEGQASTNYGTTLEQSWALLSQATNDGSRKRPLTNYELTSGCIPIFGVDDAPLPQEADLGIHETKEEQQRAQEQKRSQEIIEKFVVPNVFGSVACPNPATCPDDFHSWASRAPLSSAATTAHLAIPTSGGNSTPTDASGASDRRPYNSYNAPPQVEQVAFRDGAHSRSEGNSIDMGLSPSQHHRRYQHHQQSNTKNFVRPPKPNSKKSSNTGITPSSVPAKTNNHMPTQSRVRFGWWNVSDDGMVDEDDIGKDDEDGTIENMLQIPPIHHSSMGINIVTSLDPKPDGLRNDNLPLSRMHAALSMEQSLPYLSDRPPSYRYLQIDTQTIAFPPIKSEIEPFFCSVAIYNVETISVVGESPSSIGATGTNVGAKLKAAPIPNLQRCGRVTETLYFDHVSDEEVARRCACSLYPCMKTSANMDCPTSNYINTNHDYVSDSKEYEKFQSTRCGVFPIPSNLNVAHLYAVLIVRKVISDESYLEPYTKIPSSTGSNIIMDVEKYRANAEKNSNQHGSFLMPLAFGVAPLLQVFGTENPLIPSSRAVQIPLFRFTDKESQIIDHIMVMLFPKANHKANGIGGPAPGTNGGTAMLVMRNFGYLGLHPVIDNKSSLARDRLVDFTGELQVRRRDEDDEDSKLRRTEIEQTDGYKLILPDWRPQYVTEPTINGGRFLEGANGANAILASKSYAKELLPLSLQISPSSRTPVGTSTIRGQSGHEDIEPFFCTSFCNELLCQPRILHGYPKGNIVLKVELRDVEWSEENKSYLAHLPSCGPRIHNTRRGPYLVQSAFTSCTSRRSHQFMDEFKLKLPLTLKPQQQDGVTKNLSLFFTVFKIKLASRKRWKRGTQLLFGSNLAPEPGEHGVTGTTKLEQVACGFLPLNDQGCILENGLHDVRIVYKSYPITEGLHSLGRKASSALVLKEIFEEVKGNQHNKEDSIAEDTTISESSMMSDKIVNSDTKQDNCSGALSEDSLFKLKIAKVGVNEPMSLSVRVSVYSTVHSQNVTLSDFLNQETDIPLLSQLPNKVFLSTLRMGRDYLSKNTSIESSQNKNQSLDERLLEATIAITDHQLCPISSSGSHILRALSRLWRSFICGNGEPNLAWSNPAISTPLRSHSFATIVYLVGAISRYLAKNGVTQLDGTRKWNIVVFGRVIALLFDESTLFGDQAVEKFDDIYWSSHEALHPTPLTKTSPEKKNFPKRRRHIRNNYDLFNAMPPREPQKIQSEVLSSTAGDLASPPQKRLTTPMEAWSSSIPDYNEQHLNAPKPERRVDSKMDFQQALRAANTDVDSDMLSSDSNGNSVNNVVAATKNGSTEKGSKVFGQHSRNGSNTGKAYVQAFGDASGNRRWMTAPTKILLTIPESENGDDSDKCDSDNDFNITETDSMSTTYAELTSPTLDPPVPSEIDRFDDVVTGVSKRTKQMRRPRRPEQKGGDEKVTKVTKDCDLPPVPLILTSDDDIETKGTDFLDTIGASIGMTFSVSNKNGEEQRVGSSHHRNKKNHNRSSIDWSLMSENLTILAQPPAQEDIILEDDDAEEEQDDETMSSLKIENSTYIKLPSFLDRLIAIGTTSDENSRWFPYAYEVIIMQWSAILIEQRRSGEKPSSSANQASMSSSNDLSKAAQRSVGGAVASTPMLLEVIKKSLGFRLHKLFTQVLSKNSVYVTPPLAVLDDSLTSHLEQIITTVTDACIDSRNFDSWELRQMSVDVNDAIVRFLRDLFSFLAPSCVHRLVLAYFARFVTKEGKQISDRDSLIGFRCSWEITKMRLNAVAAFVRFPEFLKVNSPQMLNWKNWWTNSPSRMTCRFYDDIMDRYQSFRLPAFVGNDDSKTLSLQIPRMRPHWLAEIVVDICLLGTEHAEQNIQHRSSSLLHELFWCCSQESILTGTSGPVASMFLTFLEKVVANASYLANFAAKSQLRKDIVLCTIFVMQSAPISLLRALWRRLIVRMPGQDLGRFYYGDVNSQAIGTETFESNKVSSDMKDPNILGMFSVLNLSLRTIEYEGCDEHMESDNSSDNRDNLEVWHREYLLCKRGKQGNENRTPPRNEEDQRDGTELTSSTSRKWQAHDGSLVIVNTGNHIVRELYTILRNSPNGKALLNPAVQHGRQTSDQTSSKGEVSAKVKNFTMTKGETILFVRAATSLYLHALALRESDVVLVRTFRFSAEVIKMFGISVFLEAIGETLQHWMRVISFNCGARRAPVRIEATDLLELILRSSWECFGSFFRIRVPLLAVQTEVMERIVAIAASRYYREQRKTAMSFEAFSNLQAESSLVPLWRTLDRIQKQPASQNIAFRGALIRIAGKLKKLYRAYIAARVLSFIKGGREIIGEKDERKMFETEALARATRINLLRVINASAGHSKQFLGFQGTSQIPSSVAHFEAVEDALIDAADVFSPTELPEHRVAWLRMLAEFHSGRQKYAEEATCHYHIHVTLQLAARLHGSLWSNTPFLPWTDNIPDPVVYIDGDALQTEPDLQSDFFYEGNDWEYGKRLENANSFRRIFYRVANSIAIGNSEWDTGVSKNLFYGITFPDEYSTVSPWITLREMEENMAEEVEAAGHLFLKAGIIESSRFAWNLATLLYAEKFSYAKLLNAYGNLAKAVVSQVPTIDTSLPQEVLTSLGRFYRVWFHGGAPDDLSGVEFIYRTQGDVPLRRFGEELREVIKSIIPEKTPIHLVLDGVSDDRSDDESIGFTGFSRLGPIPLEPVRIKVTPLRPMFECKTRGLPEWFHEYVDELYGGPHHRSKNEVNHRGSRLPKDSSRQNGNDPHHDHYRSFSATIFSSAGSATATLSSRRGLLTANGTAERGLTFGGANDSNLRGVDKFCFVQSRDRSKGLKEWWKTNSGDYAEKSLKVTQLQVAQAFPACVARQAVAHRLVYTQSPLEAGIDALCQWCAILFRASVATAGMFVLKTNSEPGIGTDAAKVIADCIHSSRVKEFGSALLKKQSDLMEGENNTDFSLEYGRLSEDEVKKLQRKLSRLIITFIELLHLLIVRNRVLLLSIIKDRKKSIAIAAGPGGGASTGRTFARVTSAGQRADNQTRKIMNAPRQLNLDCNQSENGMVSETRSVHNHGVSDDQQSFQSVFTTTGVRTDSAIAVQSELQRSFIKLVKDLYPRLNGILQSETPRWLKQSTQDIYFSSGAYQQTKLMISEELSFLSSMEGGQSDSNGSRHRSDSRLSQSENGYDSPPHGSIAGGSQGSMISPGSEMFA